MNTLKSRLKSLIEINVEERGRFAELENLTKISANSWKSFWHGRQRPTCEMIEAAAQRWPEHAFYLVTGYEDGAYGHTAPDKEGYPSATITQPNSATYFSHIRECKIEADKIAKKWMILKFGEDAGDIEETPDNILRSVLNIGLPDDLIRGLIERMRQLTKAEKLRRAEILLHTEMPRISYDETDALGKTIKQLLDSVPNLASDTAKKTDLENKLKHELDRLTRYMEQQTVADEK